MRGHAGLVKHHDFASYEIEICDGRISTSNYQHSDQEVSPWKQFANDVVLAPVRLKHVPMRGTVGKYLLGTVGQLKRAPMFTLFKIDMDDDCIIQN